MEKPLDKLVVIIIIFILIIVISHRSYINSTKVEGFAIYLTQEDTPPAQMEALSHVKLLDRPIISHADIISYNFRIHEIKLTSSAFERISTLEVPVTGRSFMVCVEKEPIYGGAFWTPISSMSFNGVTILKPFNPQGENTIALQLGYPSTSFYNGEDPRGSIKVLESLEKADKLLTGTSLYTLDSLPHSMKGYELYSWMEGVQWHFTIITGTNRIKTLGEITSSEDAVSETGWVNIHLDDVHDVTYVLSRLPEGESVYWCDELHIGQTLGEIDLCLPPRSIVDVILESAESYGIEIVITIS